MQIENCVRCGARLFSIRDRDRFCPNHGVIQENQEWKKIEEESKEKENDN